MFIGCQTFHECRIESHRLLSETLKEAGHHETKPSPPRLENLRRSGADKAKLIVFESPVDIDTPTTFRQVLADVRIGLKTIDTFFDRSGIIFFD